MNKGRGYTTTKGFDCLAFKDKVQSEIYEETKDMTWDELKAYFRKGVESGPFADLWNRIPDRYAREEKTHSTK
jgi:hypothetical protein